MLLQIQKKVIAVPYKQRYQGKCNIWDKRKTEITKIFLSCNVSAFSTFPFSYVNT